MKDVDMLLYFVTPDEDKKKGNTNTNQEATDRAIAAFKAAKEREAKRQM